jgi:hypothetical protein
VDRLEPFHLAARNGGFQSTFFDPRRIAALFDVAGEIRNRFIALQEQVRVN